MRAGGAGEVMRAGGDVIRVGREILWGAGVVCRAVRAGVVWHPQLPPWGQRWPGRVGLPARRRHETRGRGRPVRRRVEPQSHVASPQQLRWSKAVKAFRGPNIAAEVIPSVSYSIVDLVAGGHIFTPH